MIGSVSCIRLSRVLKHSKALQVNSCELLPDIEPY